jgi:hypothetical protein
VLSSEISYSKLYGVHYLLYLFSHDGFMSYMMNHPNNMLESAHLVGQVGQPHNSPVDIESEDANEDGDGVRTES